MISRALTRLADTTTLTEMETCLLDLLLQRQDSL